MYSNPSVKKEILNIWTRLAQAIEGLARREHSSSTVDSIFKVMDRRDGLSTGCSRHYMLVPQVKEVSHERLEPAILSSMLIFQVFQSVVSSQIISFIGSWVSSMISSSLFLMLELFKSIICGFLSDSITDMEDTITWQLWTYSLEINHRLNLQ